MFVAVSNSILLSVVTVKIFFMDLKISKPEIPVNYIIKCDKCFRPLNLPSEYYKK